MVAAVRRYSLLLMLCAPVPAQMILRNEDVQFRFGVEGQFWADWTQDSTPQGSGEQGYQQNLYLRRARILIDGQLGSDVTFFLETDSPNLGKTPKAPGSGFLLQDLFLEWKPLKAIRIDGGMFLVPFSRNALQSTITYYTLDISPLTTVNNSSTQSAALRDFGLQARGFFLNDHLQYRAGMFQGERDPNARDSLRAAGYLQFDFFDTETGYTFAGTALGKQKILAVDGGFDKQGAYRSTSANLATDIPVNHGDEVGAQFQYLHYDGRRKFLAIPDQNDYLVEAAYYVHRIKAQPFVKTESQRFVSAANAGKNINRVGTGFNYYLHAQNLKWTVQYLRALPQQGSPLRPSNEFTMQLQVFYF